MKQKIANGIVSWLRHDAPLSVKMAMTPELVKKLTQEICDQFEPTDFNKAKTDKPLPSEPDDVPNGVG